MYHFRNVLGQRQQAIQIERPVRVNRVSLTIGRSLPVYPDKRTFSAPVGMSQRCQSTKSLRSSPLRGGKSRETGGQLREQRWRV